MMANMQTDDVPLRLGSAEDFARLENLLRSADFDEANVCRVLKIPTLTDFMHTDLHTFRLDDEPADLLSLLVNLFILLKAASAEEVEALIDTETLASLFALDVLRKGEFKSPKPPATGEETQDSGLRSQVSFEGYAASVFLYPVAGLWVASDRRNNPDLSAFAAPPDVVFPAIHTGTTLFLRMLPKSPAQDALDLCSGTGVAAFVLSPAARKVTASDITARSTHFARFNARLNRCDNVEAVQSDLFNAFAGRDFDRIVAHPPYVPSLSQAMIYRDAGATGEELLRRIIGELPNYLRSGGSFIATCAGWDTRNAPFEARVREWLGERQGEFDILFGFTGSTSAASLIHQLTERFGNGAPEEATKLAQLFNSFGAETLSYGTLVIHRRARNRKPLTRRMNLSGVTDGECFEWALRWHDWRTEKELSGELAQAVAQLQPRPGSHLRMQVSQVVRDGRLVPADYVLESTKPFASTTRVERGMAIMLTEFDGRRTAAEVFQAMRESALLPPSFGFQSFASLVADMIERGYLEVDELFAVNQE